MIAVLFDVKPHADKTLRLRVAAVIRDCRKRERREHAPAVSLYEASVA